MDAVLLIARLALAAVFVLAGVGKLLDLKGSQEAVKNFGVPESLARPAGLALPVVELAIAALLIPSSTALYGAIAAFLLMLLFIGLFPIISPKEINPIATVSASCIPHPLVRER